MDAQLRLLAKPQFFSPGASPHGHLGFLTAWRLGSRRSIPRGESRGCGSLKAQPHRLHCHFQCILPAKVSHRPAQVQCKRGLHKGMNPGRCGSWAPSWETSFHTPTRGLCQLASPSLCLTFHSFLSTCGSKNRGSFRLRDCVPGSHFLYFLSAPLVPWGPLTVTSWTQLSFTGVL